MAEKQKPIPKIVKVAAKAMHHPEKVTLPEIKSMGARILDDQKNDPEPHKTTKRSTKKAPAKK
jgi:hypothetical protein